MNLMRGDCLELMKEIPAGSVDMVLCDPPYGTTRNKWDAVIPFPPLWEQWHRVTKKNAAIVLFSGMPFAADAVNSNRREFRYEWIYEKTVPSGFLNANRMPLKAHENILVFYRKLPTYNPQYTMSTPYKKTHAKCSSNYDLHDGVITVSDGRRYPRDVIRAELTGGDRRFHPTQKPVALLEYLIRTYTNPGETVLDNCMGAGSTGVACVRAGRGFIGIEKDEKYFEIAERRLHRDEGCCHFGTCAER